MNESNENLVPIKMFYKVWAESPWFSDKYSYAHQG